MTFYDTTGHGTQNSTVTPGTAVTSLFTPSPSVTVGWKYNVILYPMIGNAPFPGGATVPFPVTGTP